MNSNNVNMLSSRYLSSKIPCITIDRKALSSIFSEVFEKNAEVRFRGRGISMSPFIGGGDIITLCSFSELRPEVGNVVAVRDSRGRLFVHRVVWKRNNKFLVKGDNCRLSDGYYSEKDILGVVTRVETGLSGKLTWMQRLISYRMKIGIGTENSKASRISGVMTALLSCSGLLVPVIRIARIFKPIGAKAFVKEQK